MPSLRQVVEQTGVDVDGDDENSDDNEWEVLSGDDNDDATTATGAERRWPAPARPHRR